MSRRRKKRPEIVRARERQEAGDTRPLMMILTDIRKKDGLGKHGRGRPIKTIRSDLLCSEN